MQTNNTSTMPRLPTTMSGVQLTGHGDVDRLRWSDSIPVPRPARGDVVDGRAEGRGERGSELQREAIVARVGVPERDDPDRQRSISRRRK